MNKSVMNAIELLSVQYNFSVEDAVNILTMNNKKSRTKAKVVEPKREVEDLFSQLVNEAEDAFDVAVKEALDKNPIRSIEEDNELHKRNQEVLDNICKEIDGEFVYKSESSDKKNTKKPVMTAKEKEAAAEAKKQEKLAAAEAKKLAKLQEKMNKELEKQTAQALKELKAEEAKKEKMVKKMEKLKAKELAKIKPTKEELAKKKEEEKLAKKAAAEALAQQKKAVKEQEKKALAEQKKALAEQKKALAEQKKKAPKAKVSKSEPKVETNSKASEETPVKVTVKRIKIGGQEYLKSQSNILYNPETKEEVGMYDEATNSIKPLPDDDEEELEEDN